MEIKNCGIGADIKQILRLFGPSMYKGDTINVAVKELLQNSFDAVKKQPNGYIEFTDDPVENWIACKDNGIGMSSDTVRNVYLTIGGTLKDHLNVEERSGGLGIAKIQFLMSASRLVVDTVKDGERTLLDCTQEELLTGAATIQVSHTGTPNGTTVKLYYPHKVTTLDGRTLFIGADNLRWASILRKPLIGYPDVQVKYYNRQVCIPLSNEFITSTLDFKWGKVVIYYNPYSYSPTAEEEVQVHSAGLYQFNKIFVNGYLGLNYKAYIDILPKVPAGQDGYPFNNSREGFNVCVETDVKTITKYLHDINSVLRSEYLQNVFANMPKLQYVNVDGSGFKDISIERKGSNLSFSPEFVEKLIAAFEECSTVYESKPIVEEAKTNIAALNKEELHKEDLLYKNSTSGDYQEGTLLFSKVASVIVDVLDKLKENNSLLMSSPRTPTAVGVLISKNEHGALMSGSKNILFINPIGVYMGGENWVWHIIHTLIHELAHIKYEYHGDQFCSSMHEVQQELVKLGIQQELVGQLRQIYNDSEDVLINLNTNFIKSTNI